MNWLDLDWCSLTTRRTAATLVALDLCLDSTTIWGGANGREVWANGLNKTSLHWGVGIVQSSLNDVVGEGVAKESIQLGWLQHLLNQHVLGRLLSAAETLLDDIGAELLLGQLRNSAGEHSDKRLGEDRLIEIEDVLNDVVSERILDQNIGVIGDLANQPSLLITGSMIDAALENTAAMAVGSHIDTVGSNSVKDELSIRRGKLVKALLDDMVAVQVLNQFDDAVSKGSDDGLDLARGGDEFNHLLEGPSSVLVECNADELTGGILNENSALLIIAVLEELLAEVVSKGIGHQLNDVLVGLKPNHVNLVWVAVLKLLL